MRPSGQEVPASLGNRIVMKILRKAFDRADVPDPAIFLAHEVRWWPAGAVDKLVSAGVLREIGPSPTVRCFDCDQQCDVQPDWSRSPITGEFRGFYGCGHEEYDGRLSCSLADARQWELHAESVARLLATELELAGNVVAEMAGHVYRLGLQASGVSKGSHTSGLHAFAFGMWTCRRGNTTFSREGWHSLRGLVGIQRAHQFVAQGRC